MLELCTGMLAYNANGKQEKVLKSYLSQVSLQCHVRTLFSVSSGHNPQMKF